VARFMRRRGWFLVLFKRDVRSAIDHHPTVVTTDQTIFSVQVVIADRTVFLTQVVAANRTVLALGEFSSPTQFW
jgi:hypothetical protein